MSIKKLWQIEEIFRIIKSQLEARSVYVSRQAYIEAHFLTCFVLLTIARLLERDMQGEYSVSQLLNSMRQSESTALKQNCFIFDDYDDVLEAVGDRFKIDFSARYHQLGEIKKF